MHVIRSVTAFSVTAAALHPNRHQMHASGTELMDLMAVGFAVIAFDLVSTSGVGNPDISVMIDLDAVWPCDIARTKLRTIFPSLSNSMIMFVSGRSMHTH